tara:strand:+ start:2285 stop:3004 length:720 start_codon:yes stop_codon:yes gene_type:complete
MRAHRWRSTLIGKINLIRELRKTRLIVPFDKIPDEDVIMQDLVRTFPETMWYTEHLKELREVIMCYAHTNPSVGYAQGMCFIVFILYRVFYNDCPKHAAIDTFYALHTIMRYLRPMYPRDQDDQIILNFIDSTAALTRLNFMSRHQRLAVKLRGNEFIKLLLIKTGPTLFANWFTFEDTVLIWDYLFEDIFANFINVLTAMIIQNENIYLHMKFDKTLQIISQKSFYRAASIVSCARTF